tara:strand:- start:1046 stop:1291 length:246 start_codon:yes stop_codon:yes gene_type:complete
MNMKVTRKVLENQVNKLNEAYNASHLFCLNFRKSPCSFPKQAGYWVTYKGCTLGAGVITAKEMYFFLWGFQEAADGFFKTI